MMCARGLLLLAVSIPQLLRADVIAVDFDAFTEGTAVTSQILGLVFTHTSVLTAGFSLNELEFPPLSGSNVAFDAGGAVTIDFTAPVLSFSAYFTYLRPLFIRAFDASHVLVGSVTSLYSTNLGLSGDFGSSPNELLGLSSAGGIGSISITGDPAGGSFVMDNVRVETVTVVPEPAYLPVYLAVLVIGFAAAERRRRRAIRG